MRRIQRRRYPQSFVIFHDDERKRYWIFHTPRSPYHHHWIGYFSRDSRHYWLEEMLRNSIVGLTWNMHYVKYPDLPTALESWRRLQNNPASFLMRAELS